MADTDDPRRNLSTSKTFGAVRIAYGRAGHKGPPLRGVSVILMRSRALSTLGCKKLPARATIANCG